MYKNLSGLFCAPQGYIVKFLLVMKLTVILSLFFFLQATAGGFAQRITFIKKDASLKEVFNEINKQTGYSILWSGKEAGNDLSVDADFIKSPLVKVLEKCLYKRPLMFTIEDKTIVISRKEQAETNEVQSVLQQGILIRGKIINLNGEGVPGVTVTEKGTSNFSTSANDGAYSIRVSKDGATLVFTHLSYVKQEVVSKAPVTNVRLEPKDQNLDMVVVTGYQKIDKSKFTGSVSQVDAKVIDRSGALDVSRMLQGAAAGVSVQNTSGTFGATPKIRIRGNSSISANQEPLYVINGVPITSPANVAVNQLYSGDPASVLGSAIAGLNAQDIEDIQILKDGAATALYGTRAANGVISITTKRGSFNSKNVNLSTAFSVGVKPNIAQFNLMNSAQEMQLYKEMYDRGYLSNANWPTYTGAFTETYKELAMRNYTLDDAYAELNRSLKANTNWFDVLFRNNLLQEHSISFSGGGDKHTYYVSGSYANDDGQAVGFGAERYTTDLRTVFNLTSKLNLDVNLNYSMRNQKTPGTNESSELSSTNYFEVTRSFEINPFLYAMNTSRAMYPYNEDGSYKYYTENLAPFNIMEELNENFNEIKAQEVRLMLKPSYQIFKNFRYDGTFAIRKNVSRINHTVTERSNMANAYRVDYNDVLRNQNSLLYLDPNNPNGYRESILPEGGFLNVWNTWQSFWSVRNQLSFNGNFDQHRINVLAGAEVEETFVEREYSKATGYLYYGGRIIAPSRLAMIRAVNMDDRTYIENFQRRRQAGFYSNIQYTFKDKYNLDLSGRVDGSNMFGRMTRSKFLPNYGVGLAWNLDRESFFKSIGLMQNVDFLKLRGSYALRGNSFETSPMLNATVINLVRLDAANSSKGINVLSPELYQLNWEKDYTTNLGFDLGLFKRVTLAAEYYSRKNKDLVIPFNIAVEEGFASKRINFGDMTNKGVDVTLGIKNLLNKKDFNWDLSLIYGYVKNRLVFGELQSSLLSQVTNPVGYPLEGYPLEGLFGFNFATLNSEGRPMFYGENGLTNGIVAAERNRSLVSYIGSRQPLGTGSISNSFQYKGFELRAFLTYAYGHKVFLRPLAARNYDDSGSKSGDLNFRWQTLGDENHTNIPGLVSTIQRVYLNTISNIDEVAYNRSDFRIANASNLRISEILLSYDLGKIIHKSLPSVKNARIMFSANNVYYWASGRLRGVDPDLYINGGTSLPNPRSYTMRFTLGF